MDPEARLCIDVPAGLAPRLPQKRPAQPARSTMTRRSMRHFLIGAALAAGVFGPAAQSAELTMVTRAQPDRAIPRLATQGLGYSVLHAVPGVPQRSYRVHVTCAIDESFMQTYCPTPVYEAYCPSARIACGGAAQGGRQALRLKY
jgi:hypothetical protein